MTIPVDWINGLIGGLLIGVAAWIMMLTHGRIVGISGIASRLFTTIDLASVWRWLFVIGLVLGVVLYSSVFNTPQIMINSSTSLLIVAGLLVGIGTRLSNGCTSGHGICGIARFSMRSIVATVIFMLAAFITVWLSKQIT